jgi:filamentous hemagglutinin family protein
MEGPLVMKRLITIFFAAEFLFSNPQNPTLVEGSVSFTGLTSSEVFVYPKDRSIIDWDSFSIRSGEITHFIQESQDAVVLNRVSGSAMSLLDGSLLANGKVYLINPNGVLVGKEGVVDTGGFIASTFDISNDSFLNGDETLAFDGLSLISVINEGIIHSKTGDIILLAHKVENKGILSAPQGGVAIGGGHNILVGVQGKPSLWIRTQLPGDGILNEGEIKALQSIFAAHANPFALGIQNQGNIEVVEENGEIFLSCQKGEFKNSGTVTAPKGKIGLDIQDALAINEGIIQASEGAIILNMRSESFDLLDQRPFMNAGTMDVSGKKGGSIAINSPKFSNLGTLRAEGKRGKIEVFAPGVYGDIARSKLSVDGDKGSIQIIAGHFSSSGSISARGVSGGTIQIEGERVAMAASTCTASGKMKGGTISIKSNSLASPIHLNAHVILDASGKKEGGSIHLHSSLPIDSSAKLKLEGKKQGVLSAPSTISALENSPLLIDPNPGSEPLIWAFVKAQKEMSQEIWNEAQIQLAACPPSTIQLVDPNPTGSYSSFGDEMVVLSNGNAVVVKSYDNYAAPDAGAVYLYNTSTGARISWITGSSNSDTIGFAGITALTNGNYVINSYAWNNGGATAAGAVTWGSATTGVSGVVSASNSLVGSTTNDGVGGFGVTALTNGNYVVVSTTWDDGLTTNVGAVTWGNGSTGTYGPMGTLGAVSVTNSLIGSSMSDRVGQDQLCALTNGNYVVGSRLWNGAEGAATWGDGTTGVVGVVSSMNSLVGGAPGAQMGDTVTALSDGDYVAGSILWPDGVMQYGAAAWGNGSTGTTGTASALNSLVGSTGSDQVGSGGITALTNGNYVVSSPFWDNGGTTDAGAATWGDGSGGTLGAVTSMNSLLGSSNDDGVGSQGSTALTNGNYVVISPNWDGMATDVGAVTWGNGSSGVTGTVSSSNSLVGSSMSDQVGYPGVTALTNGNYVVGSLFWNGTVGASTWGNGSTGLSVGAVSVSNSLIGSAAGDYIGNGAAALSNGHYVIGSATWSNGMSLPGVGAITWGNGTTGTSGIVSETNSFIGANSNDNIGGAGIVVLTNGNYVILSSAWNGSLGAATWRSGSGATTGTVSSSNSLVGSTSGDQVGLDGGLALTNGNYVVFSSAWQNGVATDAGAATWGSGTAGVSGVLSSTNSFIGSATSDLVGGYTTLELSNGNYIMGNIDWSSGTGAVSILHGSTGRFCTTSAGLASSSNSLLGLNTSAGLAEITSSSIGYIPTAVSFTLFSFQATEETASSPSFAKEKYDFSNAVSEGYARAENGWLSINASDIYPPFKTYKGLNLQSPSLVRTTK